MPDIDVKSDLLMALLNLIEAEHHARFSWYSTGKEEWLDRLNDKRELRAGIMKDLEREEDSQLHCYNKHILSACFRFWEVGDKYLSDGDKEKAILNYNRAFKLLEEFIATNILSPAESRSFLDKLKGGFRGR